MFFETLKVRNEGAALFADIAAPPMNLLGPELCAISYPSSSKQRLIRPSVCWCSQAPTQTTSLPMSR
ncbi:hypothetical protein CI1B_20530 [Bradyrhizobium ivorense]|uniref:Uncharacterized protein n=1 Tax=Bradyrhizobium ivorense TaxID=2511166 RepID=A0A508SZL2_9BRAD|nr:hypothetical protein CI1B_20530 [Bradyrhizobium ivorense]